MRQIINMLTSNLPLLGIDSKNRINRGLNRYFLTLISLQLIAGIVLVWYNRFQVYVLSANLMVFLLCTYFVGKDIVIHAALSLSIFDVKKSFNKRSLRRSLFIAAHAVVIGFVGGTIFYLFKGNFPHNMSPLHVFFCKHRTTADIGYFFYSVPLQVSFFFISTLMVTLVKESMFQKKYSWHIFGIQLLTVISFGWVHRTFGVDAAIFAGLTLGMAHYYCVFIRRDILAAIITHWILGSYAIYNGWVVNNHICAMIAQGYPRGKHTAEKIMRNIRNSLGKSLWHPGAIFAYSLDILTRYFTGRLLLQNHPKSIECF